jgi:hypothetical protein
MSSRLPPYAEVSRSRKPLDRRPGAQSGQCAERRPGVLGTLTPEPSVAFLIAGLAAVGAAGWLIDQAFYAGRYLRLGREMVQAAFGYYF